MTAPPGPEVAIELDNVTVSYPGGDPVLREVSLTVPEGDLCLVVGATGTGKSTLLRVVNGLVPHFTGGTLRGRVRVAGRDTRTHKPRDLADVVGVTGQDPLATFVTDTVEDELAYGMESLGVAPAAMRTRVEEVLDLLGLADVRGRALRTLSAGQQQRVAIGAVLTMQPRVLVLDEPTSALDPQAAEDVLAAVHRLVHDLGTTVLLAEHRLERVVHLADTVVALPGAGRPPAVGPPAEVLAGTAVAPPVVELGRLAGWSPLPLSVRAARREAAGLRARLLARPRPGGPAVRAGPGSTTPVAGTRGLTVRYGDRVALRAVDLTIRAGEIVAVMGRNGAGKSTLLRSLVGLARPAAGSVTVAGATPWRARPRDLVRRAGLVPQEPATLLYAETVAAECRQADTDLQAPAGRCARVLAALEPTVPPDRHPRDLSEGQRLALALAVVLTGRPPLLLLDEPTRGLDYGAKERLARLLRELAGTGHAVLLATHDVELVAGLAHRVVVLADGEVIADGDTRPVLTGSAFAPQVARVLAPAPVLTVAEVAAALGAGP